MKKFLVILVLLSVIFVVRGASSKEVVSKIKYEKLKKILNERRTLFDSGLLGLKERCPGISSKFNNAVKAFEECDNAVDDSLTFCQIIQSSAINCTAPFIKIFTDCLPEEAQQLPQLGVRSLSSVVGYLCQQRGESIFELANSCLWYNFENPTDKLQMCQRNVFIFISKHQNSIPSTHDLCTFLSTMRTCVQIVGTSCTNRKTKAVTLGLYDAIIAPCSNLNKI